MFNLFKNILNSKKTVTINLDANVSLTVMPTTGGVNAVLTETGDIFIRRETAYFSSIDELIGALRLSDETIIRKLSKAF